MLSSKLPSYSWDHQSQPDHQSDHDDRGDGGREEDRNKVSSWGSGREFIGRFIVNINLGATQAETKAVIFHSSSLFMDPSKNRLHQILLQPHLLSRKTKKFQVIFSAIGSHNPSFSSTSSLLDQIEDCLLPVECWLVLSHEPLVTQGFSRLIWCWYYFPSDLTNSIWCCGILWYYWIVLWYYCTVWCV